ncbi:MAG TPA: protein kinase [Vicinamibacterales bacterium]|nr:protein kinase [Vicinamibacterales bacterium]
MPLVPGTRLGGYEILNLIGQGGMGEVYRARDSRLGRDVAIKVLPNSLVHDSERLARFEREARVLAALNHPHIGAIYGVEQSDGGQVLILELVEGRTLADRIAQGPISLDEALPIVRQVCNALDAAHQQGIIHRDLKPSNIKIRADGTVKVLDFGLAKILVRNGPASEQSEVPTQTPEAGTRIGLILGTPAYMSPEQTRGAVVDKRTDVWAFGCVLYEVLTGRDAFAGKTVSDVIAAILEREPNWEALPARTPTPIRRLLRRCLDRDRTKRLRDIGDALLDIEEASNSQALEVDAPESVRSSRLLRYAVTLATTAVAAAAVTALVLAKRPQPTSQSPTRFTIPAPLGAAITRAVPALSPDGRTLMFAACTKCDTEDLDNWLAYRRPLDQFSAVPVPGVNGAYFFFFSPDGLSLGFCTRDGLKKVSLAGGPPVTLYEGTVLGADWGVDNTIVFGSPSGLMRISATGGKPQPITTSNPGKLHAWPTILPGGIGVLFTVWEGSPAAGTGQIAVVSLATRTERVLLKGSGSRFFAGHIIFGREGSLWAVPFDERRLDVTGEAVPVLEGVAFSPQFGLAMVAVARNGSLAYLTGDRPSPPTRTIVWVSRQGHEEALHLAAASYGWARVSPDGASVAVDVVESSGKSDIWIYNVARGTISKLTNGPGIHLFPLWTQDGQGVVFTSGPPFSFFSQRVASAEPARHLITTSVAGALAASSWSHDGKKLVFNYLSVPRMGENAPFDIGVLTTNENGAWKPLLETEAAEVAPVISPDGAWIAYSSNRTGRYEIYVEQFPGLGDRQMLSTNMGIEPLWSPDGREVFYRSLNGRQFLSVRFDAKSGRPQGSPTVLFEGAYASYLGGFRLRAYDVTPDGKRFVMLKELPGTGRGLAPNQFSVVLNWLDELKQRVPTK